MQQSGIGFFNLYPMAVFRKIHTSFWSDPFTQDLTPEQKYFYLYLITNDKTKQCGIYEITKRQICYDTGYNIDTVSKLLEYFIIGDKIRYNSSTNEIAIKNWKKYNDSASPKVQSCINQELKSVKDKTLIEYLYSMDTKSQENKNKIQEEEENKNTPTNNFKNSNLNRQPNIPTKNEVWEVFSRSGGTKEMAKSFYEKYDGTGWFIGSSPITNFSSLANKFIDNWKRNEEKGKPQDPTKVKIKC